MLSTRCHSTACFIATECQLASDSKRSQAHDQGVNNDHEKCPHRVVVAAASERELLFRFLQIINRLCCMGSAGPGTSQSSLSVLAALQPSFRGCRHHIGCLGPGRHPGRLAMKLRISSATSSVCSSNAKCPASSRWISAFGRSFLKASAPGAMKEGSFSPQTTRVGG